MFDIKIGSTVYSVPNVGLDWFNSNLKDMLAVRNLTVCPDCPTIYVFQSQSNNCCPNCQLTRLVPLTLNDMRWIKEMAEKSAKSDYTGKDELLSRLSDHI